MMGLAYEKNVVDMRESPVSGIVERLFHKKLSKNCPPGLQFSVAESGLVFIYNEG